MVFSIIISLSLVLFSPSARCEQLVVPWDVGKVLNCTVTETNRERTLVIRDHDNVLWTVSDFSRVVALFPTRDLNGFLVTVWQGGSAYRVRVFVFGDSKVRMVLDEGTYYFPELFDVDGDGTVEFLLRGRSDANTRDERLIGSQLTAYKWDGKTFSLLWSKDSRSVLRGVRQAK
jgi:hypothetical protein